jgi:hypothetical protein
MSRQRTKFAKRQREMDLKDKAKQKEERRAAKRTEERTSKGPPIAWDELAPPVAQAADEQAAVGSDSAADPAGPAPLAAAAPGALAAPSGPGPAASGAPASIARRVASDG